MYFFLWISTCNIIEVKDPGGCEQTDSTDAEPGEEPRLPRSPRRLHPAAAAAAPRRPSAQNMPLPPPLRRSPSPVHGLERAGLLLTFPDPWSAAAPALVPIHDAGGRSKGSACDQHPSAPAPGSRHRPTRRPRPQDSAAADVRGRRISAGT